MLFSAFMVNAADPVFSGRYSPNPVIIGGGSISFYGSGFGTSSSRYTVKFGSYENLSRPMLTFRDGDFGSWADNRITIRMPAIITREGNYWLRIYDGTRQVSGVTFRVVLPTPTISRYLKPDVCPGAVLTLIGRNFTNIRNAFTLLIDTKAPGATRFSGITLRPEEITSWSNNHIAVRLSANSVYIKPGYTYKVSLVKRLTNPTRLARMAVGPSAVFGTDCGGARIAPGGFRPAIGVQKPYANFRLAPIRSRVYLGQSIVFGGTFEVNDRNSLNEFRRSPLRVVWEIKKVSNGRVIKHGRLRINKRRTPFLQRSTPATTGKYVLRLRTIQRSYRLNKPDLGLKAINVVPAPVKSRRKRPQKKLLYPLPQRRF